MTEMNLRLFDVEHGACAMLWPTTNGRAGRLAMIDCGSTADWTPGAFIRNTAGRQELDYLFITNADQDHMSGLQGLQDAGVGVSTLYRNRSYSGDDIRAIKLRSGPLTRDARRYAEMCDVYTAPVTDPFEQMMDGIKVYTFHNNYPAFIDTNDLSLVAFFEFAGFKILFPGDLEKPGWRKLLENPAFRTHLADTTMLVASHHGRESGFCEEVFDYCAPRAVLISDKPIQHETQRGVLPDYRGIIQGDGVIVRSCARPRHVLTTRKDGWVHLTVQADGRFWVETEVHS